MTPYQRSAHNGHMRTLPQHLIQTNGDFRTLRGCPVNVVVEFRYPRPLHRIGEFAFLAANARRQEIFSTREHTCALALANASATSRKTRRMLERDYAAALQESKKLR